MPRAGETNPESIAELARQLGVARCTLYRRINAGWPESDWGLPSRKGYVRTPHRLRVAVCRECGSGFESNVATQLYCSDTCKRAVSRRTSERVENQYARISGNWERYFRRLLSRSFRRDELNVNSLMYLLAQQGGKCALTGMPLTCILERGVRCQTNASIDRKIAGGSYTEDNVQLVCAAINKFRIDTPLDEFIDWCKKVADYAVQKSER